MLMCKVDFVGSETGQEVGYRSLANLRSVNFNDKDLFIEYLSESLGHLTEGYVTTPVSKITFSYIIKSGLAKDHLKLLQDLESKSVTTHSFNNLNLPLSMDPADYGDIQNQSKIQINGETVERFTIINQSKIFNVDRYVSTLKNQVTILGILNYSWTDTLLDNGVVQRVIGKSEIYFVDGQIILRKKNLPAKSFTRVKGDIKIINNFVTMDIETIKRQNGKLMPYLISAYNGNKCFNKKIPSNPLKLCA
jgi:hypothetical protein